MGVPGSDIVSAKLDTLKSPGGGLAGGGKTSGSSLSLRSSRSPRRTVRPLLAPGRGGLLRSRVFRSSVLPPSVLPQPVLLNEPHATLGTRVGMGGLAVESQFGGRGKFLRNMSSNYKWQT